MTYIMGYIPIDVFLERLKSINEPSSSQDDIVAIEVLLKTVNEKLEDFLGTDMTLYVPQSTIMGSSVGEISEKLSGAEMTRLLIINDYLTQNGNVPNLKQLTMYKTENPSKDDISNEKRVLKRLEEKGVLEIKRSPASDNFDLVFVSEEGEKITNNIIHDPQLIIQIYNNSRNDKIKKFLLDYIERSRIIDQNI